MVVIMKMILKVVWHHIVEIILGMIVPTSTSLSVSILKIGNIVVNFYVKSYCTIKIYILFMNRLTMTFVVSRKIILSIYSLGLLILTRFLYINSSFIGVELFFGLKYMFLSCLL